MDLSYYRNYIRFNNTPQSDISEMSDSYNQQLSDAISTFGIRINSSEAVDIKINDINSLTTYKALLSTRKLKNETENSTTKLIQMNLNTINHGDYIYYNNEVYLVATKTEDKPIYNPDHSEAVIRLCNNNLKFIANINEVDTIMSIPCVMGDMNINLEEVKYIVTQNNQITCSVGTAYADKIKYIDDDMRFIINDKAYKIVGINNTTGVLNGEGVISIKLESDQLNEQFDDTYNGIADRWSTTNPKPVYTLNIQDLTTVNKNSSTALSYSIKNNGVEVSNPSITVTIANTSIATYNATTKVINGINTGSTTLTFVFHGADGKDYTLTGTVRVILSTSGDVNTYQILTDDVSINGEDLYNVPLYTEKTYYAQRYLNGVKMDATYTVSYTLTNCTSSQFTMSINNGAVSIYNKSAPSGSKINLTIKDNVTNIQVIKSIVLG